MMKKLIIWSVLFSYELVVRILLMIIGIVYGIVILVGVGIILVVIMK